MSEAIRIPKLSILPIAGAFLKLDDVLWYECRETFHRHCPRVREFLFCHRRDIHNDGTGTSERIAEFVKKIESKLKVQPRSELCPTQYRMIVYVKMSPWWRKSIRRSLFTAFLRAAQTYNGHNFYESLFDKKHDLNNFYTQNTEAAVRRFLDGHIHYKGWVAEWWDAFYGTNDYKPHSESELRKLLVKLV